MIRIRFFGPGELIQNYFRSAQYSKDCPQIRTRVQSYKLQMEMQKHTVPEQPKDSSSWEMLDVQSLVNGPRVHSIDGPMCRWSLKARGSKAEFIRKQTRCLTSSEEIAEVLRGDGRWKRYRRHIHMPGKSETVCEYPATFGGNVERFQTQDDFRECDQSWGIAFCRSSAG